MPMVSKFAINWEVSGGASGNTSCARVVSQQEATAQIHVLICYVSCRPPVQHRRVSRRSELDHNSTARFQLSNARFARQSIHAMKWVIKKERPCHPKGPIYAAHNAFLWSRVIYGIDSRINDQSEAFICGIVNAGAVSDHAETMCGLINQP